MVYYNFVCKRKLWYFIKDVTMEHNSDLVSMGKLIDETSYEREKKNILIDETINIDFLREWKVIHEVKKSRKIEDASIWQLKYYLWVLKQKGIEIEKGIIDYPLLRKRETIYPNDINEDEMNDVLEEIRMVMDMKSPPGTLHKTRCKKCAYYELCFI
ncbi:CRISPR-associated protein Cas4 [Alkalibaculum sporogenes]